MSKSLAALAAVLLCAEVAHAADDEFDFTCIDNGIRYRIAIFRELRGLELPCSVQTFEHPLGRYSMNWEVIWRAENQRSFCEAQVLKWVERRREEGWVCVQTKVWNERW